MVRTSLRALTDQHAVTGKPKPKPRFFSKTKPKLIKKGKSKTVTTPGLPVVLKFLKCYRCPEIVLKSAVILKFYSFGHNVLIWTLIFKFVATRWHL